MSGGWAVVLRDEDTLSLSPLRCESGVELRREPGCVWVRVDRASPELELALRKLPCVERYRTTDDRRLIRPDARVPCGTLAEDEWTPIDRYLGVEPRSAALPGETSRRVPLGLIRGGREAPSTAILTKLRAWYDYATRAPECRLEPLAFAATETGLVLVHGSPLPSLAGTPYTDHRGILVPAGYEWTPRIDAEVLRDVLDLSEGDLALFHVDGTVDTILAVQLVAASRSAVRRTTERPGSAVQGEEDPYE